LLTKNKTVIPMKKNYHRLLVLLALPFFLLAACAERQGNEETLAIGNRVDKPEVADSFEGIITMSTTMPGLPEQTSKIFVSKYGTRTEENAIAVGGTARTKIFLKEKPGIIYAINENTGGCMELITEWADDESNIVANPSANIEIESLGTETVNGYLCSHVRIAEEGVVIVEAWLTQEFPDIFNNLTNLLKNKGVEGFPIKTVMDSGNFVSQVSSIERKSLDRSLFTIPNKCNSINAYIINDLDVFQKSSDLVLRSYIDSMPLLGNDENLFELVRNNKEFFTKNGGAVQLMRLIGNTLVEKGILIKRSVGRVKEGFTQEIVGPLPTGLENLPGKVDNDLNSYGNEEISMGNEMLWLAEVLPYIAEGNYSPYYNSASPLRNQSLINAKKISPYMPPYILNSFKMQYAPILQNQIFYLVLEIRSHYGI